MTLRKILALSAMMVFVGALPAMASVSLEPLASELNISWDMDDGSPVQNSDGTWFFSILEPPSSNDTLAFQAVGELTGDPIVKDDDSSGGSTSGSLNGQDNGDGTITWESSFFPNAVAFKFGRDWYSVWTTDMATFDADTGLWSETIQMGDAPQGSLSHTAAVAGVIPEPGAIAIWAGLGSLALAGFCLRRNRQKKSFG